MTIISNTPVIPGYQIGEQLYAGSKTIVYRAIRDEDSKAVVIKLLASEYPTFNELLQFRNQYTLAKNLNFPGIVRPLSLEAYGNSYALVMEFGGVSLREYRKNVKTQHQTFLEEFLSIAIQLTDILHNLYQNRVIHKDIKPANILINPATKQIKLIDFSIASLLKRETQEIKNPNVLEGTLAYLSPEQTGRMNRGVDYRSDFYSLGVTFYELLTGKLPFISDEPMELVHCHIAKQPEPIVNQEIPQVISDIVMKLMAKNAEYRYQNALGFKHDLEKCLYQLKETKRIEYFEIAQRDICDRFIIPEKLYGRTQEVQALLEAFNRVSGVEDKENNYNVQSERSELMLVAGFSGIGKTAVVNEVHKPIVKQRGYFIKGKFDQFNGNIPFSAFVQAFRDLIEQLLTENDKSIKQWKEKILKALEDSAQVIIEVIPELESIIGKQPVIAELLGTAAQNRFNLLFQKFVKVFKNKEHPLVIFLDDLQWADSASLKLMQLLMSDSSGYLLLIGAYRDNEVFPAHPLMITLDELSAYGAAINTITLQPLNQNSLNQLVADTLNCGADLAKPLTQLIYQKTKGNPFFSNQFLKALHEDGLINFDPLSSAGSLGGWQCDITKVRETALTDDVVEFMALQLQKLPSATQNILKLAACIGNQFDLSTLAIISQQSQDETATALWRALQEEFILPQSEVYKFYIGEQQVNIEQVSQVVKYKFLHDRVQQAAYSLIPLNDKQTTHIKIGRLLWDNTPESQLEDRIFAIANQLNIGIEHFHEPKERHELARLNLIAGKKAKASTAHSSAMAYLKIGIQLLPSDSWEFDYNLSLSLYTEATEVSYLSGELDAMEDFASLVLQQAKAIIDTAKVYEIKIEAYTVQGKLFAAIDTAMEFLQPIGIEFPLEPTASDLTLFLQETQASWNNKTVAQLVDLPEMQNPELRAALRVLVKVDTPAFIAKPELHRLLILKEVALSAKYGNTSASAVAYSGYGLMLCGQPDSISTGYEFGKLALQLLSKFPDREYEAKILVVVHHFITHWFESVTVTLKPLLKAYISGLNCGQLAFAGYGAYIYCFHAYICGQELTKLASSLAIYSAALAHINQKTALNYNNIYYQVVLNLIESNTTPWELVGAVYSESEMLPLHEQTHDGTGLWNLFLNKLMLCYLFQAFDLAVEYAVKAKQYSSSGYAMASIPVLNLYDSLLQLALFPTSSPEEQQRILQQVAENQNTMQQWANHAPMNHSHRFELVEAEKYRILAEKTAAIEFYDRAIAGAFANGYIQEQALALELGAKFYLDWGKERVAASYMQEAYYCYARWGAKAKTDDLEKRYPQLLKPILQQRRLNLNPLETIGTMTRSSISTSTHTSTTNSTSIDDILDFTSVLKAAQAISSSIEVDELITTVTKIILENSGALKTVLILPQENTWQVKAITFINQDKPQREIENILVSESIDTCDNIPKKIINYVKNTQKIIVIDNCQTNIPGVIGQYMLKHEPKSVLCTPIINQGHLVGILYLENKITSYVFTNSNLEVINLLSSQAAISLENARLYQQAQQALQDLQQAQLKIVQSEKMSALGNLVAGVAHEMNNPLGFISATLKQAKPSITDITEHLKLYQETSLPNQEIIEHAESIDLDYTLEDLPKMVDGMVMACDRLKNISTSLRTFSRADKDYKIPFNIHEGIDSTILILKHRLKANEQRPAIEVITEYGNLSQIECFPGQLNQVFMNILANAIDALEESNTGRSFEDIIASPNKIRIKTFIENNNVKINIADNGKGMSEEVKQKIFDHLFTTKVVGKGTGLGLAIAKQIIEETHAGKLYCNTVLGEGTEFVIMLPL